MRDIVPKTLIRPAALLLAIATVAAAAGCLAPASAPPPSPRPSSPASPGEPALRKAAVNGVELSYTDRGDGPPVVFVHGSLADYREWLPVAGRLTGYRTITYSRRYNFPNANRPRPNHSAMVEAEDLAALLGYLGIPRAHVAGVSYGGYTALLLALEHPELVRTLVLAEPALVPWVKDLPGGARVYDDFESRMWLPAGAAFRSGDAEKALRVTMDYFVGSPGALASLPPAAQAMLRANIAEWRALTTSNDPFPLVTREAVRRLSIPALLITGESTFEIGRMVDGELGRILRESDEAIIPNGTHEMCSEYPDACAAAIRRFIEKR